MAMTPQKKIGGRKSHTLIQSPIVKRVLSTPVTLQGWLQKRGSDGLMLWKKRWFVLSDYCLFYYKDTDEEKVLGSFILPSYKISPCSNEDKVYKKYSFKAEHNNMRTYYFAADNDVLMAQWVKALTLASLLQETPGPMAKAINNQTAAANRINSDSYGYGDYQYGTSDVGIGTNSNSSDNQPLYANAPPKPKRMNEAPSPNCSPELQTLEERDARTAYPQEWTHSYYKTPHMPPISAINVQNFEKSIPESYSRNLYHQGNLQLNNETHLRNNIQQSNAINHYQHLQYFTSNPKVLNNHPPRPHSVDFLDYEAKQPQQPSAQKESKLITLPRRPKSSLSILGPKEEAFDSVHWSEESYAKKMRQSSMYVRPQVDSTPPGMMRMPPSNKQRVNTNTSNLDRPGSDIHHGLNPQEGTRGHEDSEIDPLFKRSASARLPEPDQQYQANIKNISNDGDNNENFDRKKTHQKEESMKRLLEWKQRMLQSPLTQKVPPKQTEYTTYNKEVSVNPEILTKGTMYNSDSQNPNIFYQKGIEIMKKQDEGLEKTNTRQDFTIDKGIIKRNYGTLYKDQSNNQINVGKVEMKANYRDCELRGEGQMSTAKVESETLNKPPIFPHITRCYSNDKRSSSSANSSFDSNKPIYSNTIIDNKQSPSTFDFPRDRKAVKPQPYNSNTEEKRGVVDEEWGLKLDESRVIKEFSYHYIKGDNHEGIPCNRGIEMMQPNYKTRHLQTHSSKQEESVKKQVDILKSPILNFEQKPNIRCGEEAKPRAPTGILKTSKQKKVQSKLDESHKIQNRTDWTQENSDDYMKKQVLSDTETLLYDTSSDVDEKRPVCVTLKQTSSSDDDRDEEVASVLAKEHKLTGLCQTPTESESTMKHMTVNSKDGEKRITFSRPLSLPDSNSTLPEENYMPMTPRRRPMSTTPTKESDQSNPLTSPHRISLEHVLDAVEECPYVEMNQNGKDKSKSTKVSQTPKDADFDLESSTYIDLDTSKNLNYELHVYNEMQSQEPLYMEVKDKNMSESNFISREISSVSFIELENKDEESCEGRDVSARTSLPDILTTAPSFNHGSGRSDSSDADDEASKDLDSIDAPRHPRFSLSDTFRPASYYLGNSLSERTIIAMNSDNPDSSDSDLVSPPPIPTSSPPLDDLDTSIDSTINNKISPAGSKEKFETNFCREAKCNYSCKKSDTPLDLGSSEEESIKSDRTDLFLKRRPLSADILSSFHEFSVLDTPSPREAKSSSDVESIENGKTKSIYQQDNEFYDQQDLKISKLIDNQPYYCSQKDELFERSDVTNRMFNEVKRECLEASNMKTSDYTLKLNGCKPINSSHLYRSSNNQFNANVSNDQSTSTDGYQQKNNHQNSDDINEYIIHSVPIGFSQDQQNSAPYYYSDLLKDQRNNAHMKNLRTSKEKLQGETFYPSELYVHDSNGNPISRDGTFMNNADVTMPLQQSERMKINAARSSSTTYKRNETNSENRKIIENKKPTQEEKSLELHNRSRSLEGLMDSKTPNYHSQIVQSQQILVGPQIPMAQVSKSGTLRSINNQTQRTADLWDEDALWRENLRKTSVRHTRSLEDLDKKVEVPTSPGHNQTRPEAVYVNSDFSRGQNNEIAHRGSIDKDREKIRQWDLLSSAPATLSTSHIVNPTVSESKPFLTTKTAHGTASEPNYNQTPPKGEQRAVASPQATNNRQPENKQRGNWHLKLSAGELLGRTHEELVLLLIQLRRQRAGVCKSMERCHREIEAQACLTDYDAANRLEHLQRLEELKSRLLELEKQYEKGKPLVNLVDNMVKLGSLYQSGSQTVPTQRLEFNHKVQEQRILADERRDWERIRPDHHDLQVKVEQLYRLDKLLQEESGTLHSLQEDKGILERALGGLRNKLQGVHGNSAETEWYRRQQRLLERELSRVRSILALNSKKLEETVAENARLEQELVVIRQKLQISRRTTEPGGATTAALESELCRVQLLVGNLLRQRQELSLQVHQLTEKSHSLSQQIWPSPNSGPSNNSRKKQSTSGWVETDLDVEATPNGESNPQPTRDINYISPLYVNTDNVDKRLQHIPEVSNYHEECLEDMSSLTARSPELYRQYEADEDGTKRPYGLMWKEKPQEIKTVRIVKRESERRQRDRDRSGNLGIPLTSINTKRVIPEEDLCNNSVELSSERPLDETICYNETNDGTPPTPGPRSDSVNAVWNIVRKNKLKGNMVSGVNSLDKEEFNLSSDSPQLSPVYLSEAARKIVEEVAWQGKGEKRLVPKEKRRHHTVSGPSIMTPKSVYSQRGSRDDLDMERVLRPRLTTPDVVRSTLNRTDPNFTKETIDNILGAPGKIVIPERYIPETQPQLTKEEIQKRSKKADAIRKMLCETATVSPKDAEVKEKTSTLKHKVEEEKRNREHLLQLSQILAQEVMEKSKIVAVRALASLPLEPNPIEEESDYDDLSPTSMLPLYQQRENFYS
ncbi:uncharacterized protein LOC106667180 isoform X2 [Cimex lectularius]|uniref:PH domain-containing protein n=1 Tax=Cimex lectularius TaxID=79782 RepID=A0A8I6RUH1_CIMLE|nr:uncharacterized protein LOC106667180 isoform X2 [Cimex lectularius]